MANPLAIKAKTAMVKFSKAKGNANYNVSRWKTVSYKIIVK